MILNPLVAVIARAAAAAARVGAAVAKAARAAGKVAGGAGRAASKRWGKASGKTRLGRLKTARKDLQRAKRAKQALDKWKKDKDAKRRAALGRRPSREGSRPGAGETLGRLGRVGVPVGSKPQAGPGEGSGATLHREQDGPEASWFQRLIKSSEGNVLEHLKSVSGLGGGDDAGRPSGGGGADPDLVSRLWNLMNPQQQESPGGGARTALGSGDDEEMFLSTELEHSAATARPATGATAGDAAGRPEGVGAPMPGYDPEAIRLGAPKLGSGVSPPPVPRPPSRPAPAPVGGGDGVEVNVESPDAGGAPPAGGPDKSMFSRLLGRLGGGDREDEGGGKGFLDRWMGGGGEEIPELTTEERDEAVSGMPGLDEGDLPPLASPEEIESLNKEAQESQFEAIKATEEENAAREKAALGTDGFMGSLSLLGTAIKGLFTVGITLIPVATKFAEALVLAQQHLQVYSGTMALAMANLERQQFMLDVRQARATEGSFYALTEELAEMRENTQPIREISANLKNVLGTAFLRLVNLVAEPLGRIAKNIDDFAVEKGWWAPSLNEGDIPFREALKDFHNGNIANRNPGLGPRNRPGGDMHQPGQPFPAQNIP